MTGRFISFEGIDGAGKSTHIGPVADYLRERALPVVVTREPGGTELADAVREWLLTRDMSARTETLLAFAARRDHVERVIAPALAAGQWILCDRFTDSTRAYQGGGRELGIDAIESLATWAIGDLVPDRTYWFALDPIIAARRRSAAREADRFEREREAFFGRVDAAYRRQALAEPARIRRIDASQSPALIETQLRLDLDGWLASLALAPSAGQGAGPGASRGTGQGAGQGTRRGTGEAPPPVAGRDPAAASAPRPPADDR